MSLFDIDTGDRIARALERIADAAERAFPPVNPISPRPEPEAELSEITLEDQLRWETEQRQQEAAGKAE